MSPVPGRRLIRVSAPARPFCASRPLTGVRWRATRPPRHIRRRLTFAARDRTTPIFLQPSSALCLTGTAFELVLQALEFPADGFATLFIHHPAEQDEHDLDEAFASHCGFLGHARAAVQVFEAIFGLDVKALSGQADRRLGRRFPEGDDALKVHPTSSLVDDPAECRADTFLVLDDLVLDNGETPLRDLLVGVSEDFADRPRDLNAG